MHAGMRGEAAVNALVIVLVVAVAAVAAVFAVRRVRKGGGCCGEHETVKRRGASDRNPAHYPYGAELTIGGMTCENCARRVENALNELEGTWATVRIDGCRARVRCKQPPDEAALRRAVREAGYVVTGYAESRDAR